MAPLLPAAVLVPNDYFAINLKSAAHFQAFSPASRSGSGRRPAAPGNMVGVEDVAHRPTGKFRCRFLAVGIANAIFEEFKRRIGLDDCHIDEPL